MKLLENQTSSYLVKNININIKLTSKLVHFVLGMGGLNQLKLNTFTLI